MKRHFEFKDATSSKFWEIELQENSFTVRFGKIGTDGQSNEKIFDDEATAQKEYDKLIREKTKKGYVETTATVTATRPAESRNNDPIVQFKEIPLKKAIKKFNLNTVLGNAIGSDWENEAEENGDAHVRLYDGDAQIDEFVNLHDLWGEENCAGIIVTGNLTVNHSIIDYEIDTSSAFLYVKGDLRCQNLALGCAEVIINGSVWINQALIGFYNHGYVHIKGDLNAWLFIQQDLTICIDGAIKAFKFSRNEAEPEWADFTKWNDILQPGMLDELCKEEQEEYGADDEDDEDDKTIFEGSVPLLKRLEQNKLVFLQELKGKKNTLLPVAQPKTTTYELLAIQQSGFTQKDIFLMLGKSINEPLFKKLVAPMTFNKKIKQVPCNEDYNPYKHDHFYYSTDRQTGIYFQLNSAIHYQPFYPPQKEGKDWLTRVHRVIFYDRNKKMVALIKQKHPFFFDKEFWNLTPPPTASYEEWRAFFGTEPDEDHYFTKIIDLGEYDAGIVAGFDDKKKLTILRIGVREYQAGEILPYYEYADYENASLEFCCMVIKYLLDRQSFKPEIMDKAKNYTIENTVDSVLPFYKNELGGYLWPVHLLEEQWMLYSELIGKIKTMLSDPESIVLISLVSKEILTDPDRPKAPHFARFSDYTRFCVFMDKHIARLMRKKNNEPEPNAAKMKTIDWSDRTKFQLIPMNEFNKPVPPGAFMPGTRTWDDAPDESLFVMYHDGDLEIDDLHLSTDFLEDEHVFTLYIDGNLTIHGNLRGSFAFMAGTLIVTGNLTCANAFFAENYVAIGGGLTVRGILASGEFWKQAEGYREPDTYRRVVVEGNVEADVFVQYDGYPWDIKGEFRAARVVPALTPSVDDLSCFTQMAKVEGWEFDKKQKRYIYDYYGHGLHSVMGEITELCDDND